jgi:hypothetical protein
MTIVLLMLAGLVLWVFSWGIWLLIDSRRW